MTSTDAIAMMATTRTSGEATQPQFVMLGGLERQRPAGHLIRLFELAAAAGALSQPGLAVERMGEMLSRSAHPGPV